MSNAAVLAALKAIAAGQATPCFWPNDRIGLTPPDPPSPFIWAEVNSLGADLMGSGTNPASARHGFIRLHVMVPFGGGLEGAYAIADTLSGLFAVLANAGGVIGLNTFAPTTPEIGAQSDDGLWYGVSISVPWVYWASAAA